jgi:hypothetical protein
MPFKSEAQRRWMYENKPELAKEFQRETPQNAKLPEKASGKKNKPKNPLGSKPRGLSPKGKKRHPLGSL